MPELHDIADEIDRIANECASATTERPVLPYRLESLGDVLLQAGELGAFDTALKGRLARLRKTDARWGEIWSDVWNHLVRTHVIQSPASDDSAGRAESCHAIARHIRSFGKFVTSAEAAERMGVDKTTITRHCNAGKFPGAIPKSDPSNTSGEWRIPEASVPIAKPDPAKPSKRKRPKLGVAAEWDCIECGNTITSKSKPTVCPKCHHHAFTRKLLKPSAI
jgi:DNA-directed RNA polymerase subunit RPC12/RpoP